MIEISIKHQPQFQTRQKFYFVYIRKDLFLAGKKLRLNGFNLLHFHSDILGVHKRRKVQNNQTHSSRPAIF